MHICMCLWFVYESVYIYFAMNIACHTCSYSFRKLGENTGLLSCSLMVGPRLYKSDPFVTCCSPFQQSVVLVVVWVQKCGREFSGTEQRFHSIYHSETIRYYCEKTSPLSKGKIYH